MSLVYFPICGGILVVFSNKFFKNDALIEEIAIKIVEDEETANNKKASDDKAMYSSLELNGAFE